MNTHSIQLLFKGLKVLTPTNRAHLVLVMGRACLIRVPRSYINDGDTCDFKGLRHHKIKVYSKDKNKEERKGQTYVLSLQ
jgi:hypothetical protein